MKPTNNKTRSIVNRLHGRFRRQKFFSTLFFDLTAAALVLLTWGLTMESSVGGQIFGVHRRWITWDGPTLSADLSRFFDSLTYHVDVQGTPYAFDASGIASLVTVLLPALFLIQLLLFWMGSAADRHTIRRILRPIDEIAMTAERLSGKTPGLFRDEGEEASLQQIADALDHIDGLGEDARITVRDSELAGLEAAVNNMLRRLSESQKQQIRFVDDASHELRTPIAVIQGYIGMLDRWGKDDPKVMEESIAAIKSEAEHMKTLVDQLLFLARGESDRLELKKERLDGCVLLRELWEEYQMIDTEHQYDLNLPASGTADPAEEYALSPVSLWIHGDPALLKQSLRTMLDNAKKFTPSGGTITLIAKAVEKSGVSGSPAREICLEIADSGIGIPSEDLPRIFDRFWRGSAARSGTGGSGLGLSIARWIVSRHGGRIDVASAPGIGTRIGVVLEEAAE